MWAKYIFRLDDISWDMNYENFSRIRDLFIKYRIQPIIGVIPNNKDEMLKKQIGRIHITQEQFWNEIRDLQQNHGWTVALHGYEHMYTTNESGIMGINNFSEFAGLPYSKQYEKIKKGKELLEQNGIKINSFMAPAHSFDTETLNALKANDITTITDGYGLYPFEKHEITFVPQLTSKPRQFLFGIYTFCQHINKWQDDDFNQIEKYVKVNTDNFVSFIDISNHKYHFFLKGFNYATKILFEILLKLARKAKRF